MFCNDCFRQVFFIWEIKKVIAGRVRQVVILYSNNSSNVNETIKTILNFFCFFFYEKILNTQKSTKSIKITKTQISKQATFLPLDVFYGHKNAAFFVFVCALCFFLCVKFCRKKEAKKFKIALIASFTILLCKYMISYTTL